jgi:serine phosphatase RsbU (regulator of sigma subunit)
VALPQPTSAASAEPFPTQPSAGSSPNEPLPAVAAESRPLNVLLVEDDDADALLVEEYLADFSEPVRLQRARTIGEATARLPGIDCVLLDLGLPDTTGLDGLHELDRRGNAAIVVLTGDVDGARGRRAVGSGAQDYLLKGQIDGQLLGRTVQYAVERHRAEHIARQLHEAKVHERENQRLERGLLPSGLLDGDPDLRLASRYEPGHQQLLLGGDFFDAVRTRNGSVHLIIGDVCGHGPDEAALGVCLRIAWRSLITAGIPAGHTLPVLQEILAEERPAREIFATAAVVSVAPDHRRLSVLLAGHPAPLLTTEDDVSLVDGSRRGVPLGILPDATWEPVEIDVDPGWALLMYTDGLVEGRDTTGEQLWPEGLLERVRRLLLTHGSAPDTADHTITPTAWNSALLTSLVEDIKATHPDRGDDLAALLLAHVAANDG